MDPSSEKQATEPFDAFAVLGLEPDLTTADEVIETAWRSLSRDHHPDAASGDADRAAQIHRAYQVLRSPGNRLRHWLERRGVTPKRQTTIAPDLMDLFTEIGPLIQSADDLARKKNAASSALGRALLAEEEIKTQQALQKMLGRLQRAQGETLDRFPAFKAQVTGSGHTAEALAAVGSLGFLEKWQQQVQERLMTLIAG